SPQCRRRMVRRDADRDTAARAAAGEGPASTAADRLRDDGVGQPRRCVDGGVPSGIDRGTTAQEITYNPLLEYVRLKPDATVLIRSGSMLAARPFRFIVIALCLAAPALIAQVPSAS